MEVEIAKEWRDLLGDEFEREYFKELIDFVGLEYSQYTIYPKESNIFRAFDKCSPQDVKVVIIGQDPYHGEGQANGLSFSVAEDIPLPPSLRNIFKEINSDLNTPIPSTGELDRWAEQGVLLLNSVLTVRQNSAGSHAKKGWEIFTDSVVRRVAKHNNGVVYMLWGAYAQKKAAFVDAEANCILKSVHPSPLSSYRGFFGCKHFSKANEYLQSMGKLPIIW